WCTCTCMRWTRMRPGCCAPISSPPASASRASPSSSSGSCRTASTAGPCRPPRPSFADVATSPALTRRQEPLAHEAAERPEGGRDGQGHEDRGELEDERASEPRDRLERRRERLMHLGREDAAEEEREKERAWCGDGAE